MRPGWLGLGLALLACSGPSQHSLARSVAGGHRDTVLVQPGDTLLVIGAAVPVPPDTTPPVDTTGEVAFSADSFVSTIGVQLHLSYSGIYTTGWASIVKPKLLALGVRHFRERMNGSNATSVARWVELADSGLSMTAGCWPQGTDSVKLRTAAHCISMANQIANSSKRGRAAIAAFDGWNEVDGQNLGTSWPDKWVTWGDTWYKAKQADPLWKDTPLYANSLASAAEADKVVAAAPKGNKSAMLDAGNMHAYPGGGATPSSIKTSWVPQWKKIAGAKPLANTETGYHTCIPNCSNGTGVDSVSQAKYGSRLWFDFFNVGSVRTFWYEMMDEGPQGTNTREDHWGLVRYDGQEKPLYGTVKNLITLLRDPGPSFPAGRLTYTLSPSVPHTLLAKRNGRKYLALWQDVKVYDPGAEKPITNAPVSVTLTLGTAASALNVYRPRTGAAPIQSGSGTTLTLSVPDEAIIVEVVP